LVGSIENWPIMNHTERKITAISVCITSIDMESPQQHIHEPPSLWKSSSMRRWIVHRLTWLGIIIEDRSPGQFFRTPCAPPSIPLLRPLQSVAIRRVGFRSEVADGVSGEPGQSCRCGSAGDDARTKPRERAGGVKHPATNS
jgi:hypothetical protein